MQTGLHNDTQIMGVLYLTPAAADSRRGRAEAVAAGRRLIEEGADIVQIAVAADFGNGAAGVAGRTGETTEGLAEVVRALAGDVRVAVDTAESAPAAAAVAAGASLLTDTTGTALRTDTTYTTYTAVAGAAWVEVYAPLPWNGAGSSADPTKQVAEALARQAERARLAGVGEIYLDPGIGLGHVGAEQEAQLLARLGRITALGPPVVVSSDRPEGLEPSLAAAVWAMLAGAAVVRTRHVAAVAEAARAVGAKPPVGRP